MIKWFYYFYDIITRRNFGSTSTLLIGQKMEHFYTFCVQSVSFLRDQQPCWREWPLWRHARTRNGQIKFNTCCYLWILCRISLPPLKWTLSDRNLRLTQVSFKLRFQWRLMFHFQFFFPCTDKVTIYQFMLFVQFYLFRTMNVTTFIWRRLTFINNQTIIFFKIIFDCRIFLYFCFCYLVYLSSNIWL